MEVETSFVKINGCCHPKVIKAFIKALNPKKKTVSVYSVPSSFTWKRIVGNLKASTNIYDVPLGKKEQSSWMKRVWRALEEFEVMGKERQRLGSEATGDVITKPIFNKPRK